MIFTIVFLLFSLVVAPETTPEACMSAEEKELYTLINDYRKSKRLSAIPISAKLNKVARTHAIDLVENYTFDVTNKCNPHSWSDKGSWTPCCYTIDHAQAECMWEKPKEIAGYASSGYEIAYYHSNIAQPLDALDGWKSSSSHNPIIINKGMWSQVEWKAIGVGIYKNFAIVWFGEMLDESKCED